MPVENEYERIRLESDGANTEYDFDFKITDESEVKVSSVVRATGVVDEVLVLNTDYTVEISTTTEGGTVTLTTPLANTYDVLLESDMANTQTLRAGGLGVFNPAQIVAALDRTVRLIQQVVEKTARTLRLPDTTEIGGYSLEIPTPEANKLIGWNSDGDALENKVAVDADVASSCASSKTAAQTAQGLAEDARDAAIVAQGLAEEAAEAAELIADLEVASEAEAEAGVDNSKMMTPLRTAQAIAALVAETIYPVGVVVTLGVATNPATLFGVGAWTAIAGKVIVGIDATQTEFDTLNETGGAKTHTLTVNEIPAHTHTYTKPNSAIGGGGGSDLRRSPDGTFNTGSTGGGAAHNNLQPYIVKYVWERTA